MKPSQSLPAIEKEFNRASELFPAFHSNHEGYAVLKEEIDELWDAIKKSKSVTLDNQMKHELIQIAAMAVRFLNDLDK